MNEFDKKKENRDKAIAKVKEVIHDRGISAAKDEVISNAITYGAGGAALGYGIKREIGNKKWTRLNSIEKKQVLKKSVLGKAIPVLAVTGAMTDALVPAVRLHNLHNKEFGTNPTVQDYTKLTLTKGVPSVIYYGALYKNKDKLADSLTKTVKNAPKIVTAPNWDKRKKAIKLVAAGAAAGGALDILDEGAGMVQLLHTPETIVKSKKRNLKGEHTMNVKKAHDLVEGLYEKIAMEEETAEDSIEITAEEIINEGFDKIASKSNLLGGIGDVLTGKNVTKAKQALNLAEAGSNVASGTNRVMDATGSQMDGIIRDSVNKAKAFGKEKGIRIDRNGQKVNSQFSGATEAELDSYLNRNRSRAGQLAKEQRTNRDAVNDIKKRVDAAKKQTKSERTGVFGKAEDLVNYRTYKNNKAFNQKREDILQRMNQGKAISNKDLSQTKKTLFGGKKVIPNGDFTAEIKDYNNAIANANKAQKKLKMTQNDINTLKHESNALKNSKELSSYTGKINSSKELQGKVNDMRQTRDNIAGIGRELGLSNPLNKATEKARSNYNKEVAKTVGTYGAIGGAGLLGASALNGTKRKDENVPQGQFRPQYNYSSR